VSSDDHEATRYLVFSTSPITSPLLCPNNLPQHPTLDQSFSTTGPGEVLLEFVILVF